MARSALARALLLSLGLAGCARASYGSLGEGDPQGSLGDVAQAGGDGPGGDETATGGSCASVESCNGIDDTCDGRVDEGCPCTPFDVVVASSGSAGGDFPRFVWTGSSWLVSYRTSVNLRVATLSDTGAVIDDNPIAPGGAFPAYGEPGMAWTGAEAGLCWIDGATGRATLTRLNPDGSTIEHLEITPSLAISALVVWTGQAYEVVWSAGWDPDPTSLWARRFDPESGSLTAPAQLLVSDETMLLRGLDVTPTGAVVFWAQWSATSSSLRVGHLQRGITATPSLTVADAIASPGNLDGVDGAWVGDAAVAVGCTTSLSGLFARVNLATGTFSTAPHANCQTQLVVAWSGDVLVEAQFFVDTTATPRALRLQTRNFDAFGSIQGPTTPWWATDIPSSHGYGPPSLVAHAQRYAVAWPQWDGVNPSEVRLSQRCLP